MRVRTTTAKKDHALLAVFLACRSTLTRMVGRIVNRHDVDDILQEAFARSYEAAGKSVIRSPRAFLLKTATNLALNHVSRAGNKLNTSLDELPLTESESLSTQSPESQFDASQRFVVLCRAIGSLPEQCRRVFILKKVYGLSQQEIALQLTISESTVEKHIAKALLMCKRYMDVSGAETRDDAAAQSADMAAKRQAR